ncbi:MAG TPA: D-aminoacyl-tRNA deacylase [bacterium]|nr:D-aminoacyl-tRNA deacylase [bacterium]
MRVVIQRVSQASVEVDEKTVGAIGAGLVVLLAEGHEDTESTADWMAEKITSLRIFNDADGKMNRSLGETEGSLLVISQFTLYGDCIKGRRPSFTDSALPDKAILLYEYFVTRCKQLGFRVEQGVFGAMMLVHIDNDGPVTFVLER